jgi:hypothetical protein
MWVLTVLLLAVIAGLVVVEIRGILSERGQHQGEVTVADCTFLSFARHVNTYTCEGSFTSDAADIRVPRVTFTNAGRLDPGSRVAATVSGPEDTTAHLVSESRWRLVLTTGFALGTAGLLVGLWRGTGRRREG